MIMLYGCVLDVLKYCMSKNDDNDTMQYPRLKTHNNKYCTNLRDTPKQQNDMLQKNLAAREI